MSDKCNCNLNCPPNLKFFCCNNCQNKGWTKWWRDKKGFEDKWSDKRGFNSSEGCVLGADRPPECKAYDCHEYRFFQTYTADKNGNWGGHAWDAVHEDKVDQEFCDKMNDLLKENQ